ncbi:MAG: hypothetical protein ACK4K0_08125 [Flavobacteriales bacterium]
MRMLLFISLFLFCSISTAQVSVDKKIIFTGNEEGRTIENVGLASDSLDAASQHNHQHNEYTFLTQSNNSDTILVTSTPFFQELLPGLNINTLVSIKNTGPVFLKVNGLNAVEVLTPNLQSFKKNELTPNKILHLVYNGQYFISINTLRGDCPQGFVSANDKYCISINEVSVEKTFFDAIITCEQLGARICSWAEWANACDKSASLGLMNMLNNWEWINTSGDHNIEVKTIGLNFCVNTLSAQAEFLRGVRCCYSK